LASSAPFEVWYLRVRSSTAQTASRPPIEATPKPSYGYLDEARCSGLSGWAADLGNLDAAVSVDLLDGSTLIATLEANEFRPDLVTGRLGNGRHAFNYALPSALLGGKPHVMHVRIAGTTVELIGSPATVICTASGFRPHDVSRGSLPHEAELTSPTRRDHR
jgi:hypothetical protein